MISDRLNSIRKDRGLTNQQLADMSELPLSTVTKIMNGETKDPTITSVNAIAIALGISIDELFIEKEPTSEPLPKQDVVPRQLFDILLSEKNKQISKLQAEKKVLFIFLMACFAVLFGFTLYDAINGRVGWIRYGEQAHSLLQGIKQALFLG